MKTQKTILAVLGTCVLLGLTSIASAAPDGATSRSRAACADAADPDVTELTQAAEQRAQELIDRLTGTPTRTKATRARIYSLMLANAMLAANLSCEAPLATRLESARLHDNHAISATTAAALLVRARLPGVLNPMARYPGQRRILGVRR